MGDVTKPGNLACYDCWRAWSMMTSKKIWHPLWNSEISNSDISLDCSCDILLGSFWKWISDVDCLFMQWIYFICLQRCNWLLCAYFLDAKRLFSMSQSWLLWTISCVNKQLSQANFMIYEINFLLDKCKLAQSDLDSYFSSSRNDNPNGEIIP